MYNEKNIKGESEKAFTLAEVLITLGIIGVVASMTLPTVVGHFSKKEAESRLKKFYSAMSQAILLAENDYGPSKNWDKTYIVYNGDGTYDSETNRNLTITYFNKYLKPYLKYVKVDENPPDSQDKIRIYLSDGSTFTMYNGACTDLYYDVNGMKLPNTDGQDIFHFVICPESKAESECGGNKNWCAYCTNCTTRAKALQKCKNSSINCTRLLMFDGWEFKEDYPYLLK